MDEVIQYRKDQKASGGGRMVYKGIKLNNRTMHNFRPTIGKNISSSVKSSLTPLLEKPEILESEENISFAGQFVSTYNICFATRLA